MTVLTRRDFVKGITITSAALATRILVVPQAAEAKGLRTRRYAMLIDLRRCVGCESCTIACKSENNVGVDPSWASSRRLMWNKLIYSETKGEQSRPDIRWIPRPCNHCENPACVKVCPVGATYRDEERGLVLQDYGRCIGCRMCMAACPYGVRSFNWERPAFPHAQRVGSAAFSSRKGGFNPLVPVRPRGVVEKCVFCVQRINVAQARAIRESRELRDGEVQPACVTTCLAQARIFGDLNDPESRIATVLRDMGDRVFRLLEDVGTEPKVFFIPEA